MEFTDIVTTSGPFDSSVIFHVVVDTLGFMLFMHQQIPSLLPDITLEFEELRSELKDLDAILSQNVTKANLRKNAARKREVKQGIRRLDKLITGISCMKSALQLVISEISEIEQIILALGPSPVRPISVYEFCFPQSRVVSVDFTRSKFAEALSKKVVRTLLSKGAGSDTCAGPTKLFLLVKAPPSFNMPMHFLPKRDFKYSKKAVPFRLRITCKAKALEMDAAAWDEQKTSSSKPESVWFQCRHTIKGLPSRNSLVEDS